MKIFNLKFLQISQFFVKLAILDSPSADELIYILSSIAICYFVIMYVTAEDKIKNLSHLTLRRKWQFKTVEHCSFPKTKLSRRSR